MRRKDNRGRGSKKTHNMAIDAAFTFSGIVVEREARNRKEVPQPRSARKETS